MATAQRGDLLLNHEIPEPVSARHLRDVTRSRIGGRRWGIGFLLAAGVLISYIDRVNLSVAHDALTQRFAISRHTFGFLLSAYNFTYCLCQLPMGLILDRFGVRRIGRLSTLVWSIASFAAGATTSLGALFGARFLLGVGEAPTFPAAAKATGNWFPERERSRATALFDSAAKFASAIGVPLIGTLLLAIGWRLSFVLTGVLSLLFFWAFTAIYKEPEEDPKLSAAELAYIRQDELMQDANELAPIKLSLLELLRQRKVIGLALGVLAYNYCFYMLLTWLPTYLSSSLHVDLQRSFLYTGVPWIVATVVDLVVGGWLVDLLAGRSRNAGKVRIAFLVVGMAFGLGILGAAPAHTAGVALFWITVSLAGLSAHAPVVWSAPALIAPRNNVATVGGIVNCTGQLAAIAAPIVTGYLSFKQAFLVAGALQCMGMLAYVFLLRSVEPMKLQRAG
ncbi:Sugar phosphate permease [Bryocella elongata]|uniref:Sugar phosphate permease n=1 Tax=Bryocella elongata TaxID=863522 RepID=A0A1H5Z264_9BACT|nr:MFS transporter [Bryocella elongata]SEG30593.1 Sugar phosphate permease [Bryocella elongata]